MNPSSLLRVLVPVLLLGASCLVALPATAVPITYRLSGVGSGHLGSQAFSDAAFVFTGVGDTDAIAPIGGGVWVNPLLSLQVQVSGHGTAQGLHAVDFFVNNTSGGLGFLDELVGDIIDVLGPGVGDFDGVSAFGPLAVDVDYLAPFSTTAGEFLLAQGGLAGVYGPVGASHGAGAGLVLAGGQRLAGPGLGPAARTPVHRRGSVLCPRPAGLVRARRVGRCCRGRLAWRGVVWRGGCWSLVASR